MSDNFSQQLSENRARYQEGLLGLRKDLRDHWSRILASAVAVNALIITSLTANRVFVQGYAAGFLIAALCVGLVTVVLTLYRLHKEHKNYAGVITKDWAFNDDYLNIQARANTLLNADSYIDALAKWHAEDVSDEERETAKAKLGELVSKHRWQKVWSIEPTHFTTRKNLWSYVHENLLRVDELVGCGLIVSLALFAIGFFVAWF